MQLIDSPLGNQQATSPYLSFEKEYQKEILYSTFEPLMR